MILRQSLLKYSSHYLNNAFAKERSMNIINTVESVNRILVSCCCIKLIIGCEPVLILVSYGLY